MMRKLSLYRKGVTRSLRWNAVRMWSGLAKPHSMQLPSMQGLLPRDGFACGRCGHSPRNHVVWPSLAVGLRSCLPLHAHRDNLRAVATSLHVDDAGSLDEVCEAGKAAVACIEVWRLFRQMGANSRQVGPAIFIGRRGHSVFQHLQCGRVKLRFCRRLGGGCLGLLRFRYSGRLRIVARRLRLDRVGVEYVEKDELVASGNEWARGLRSPKP